jgi:hypothetical protein
MHVRPALSRQKIGTGDGSPHFGRFAGRANTNDGLSTPPDLGLQPDYRLAERCSVPPRISMLLLPSCGRIHSTHHAMSVSHCTTE